MTTQRQGPDDGDPKTERQRELELELQLEQLKLERFRVQNERKLAELRIEAERPDRRVIYFQLALGASLVVTGGLMVGLFTYTESVASAIVGAGAALLPAGAAASASARIRDKSNGASNGAENGSQGTGAQTTVEPNAGVNGQADKEVVDEQRAKAPVAAAQPEEQLVNEKAAAAQQPVEEQLQENPDEHEDEDEGQTLVPA